MALHTPFSTHHASTPQRKAPDARPTASEPSPGVQPRDHPYRAAAARQHHRGALPAHLERRDHRRGGGQGGHRLHRQPRRAHARREHRADRRGSARDLSRRPGGHGGWAATCAGTSSTPSSTSPRRRWPFGAPTLISRNTNDVTQVQMVLFMGFALLVSTPIMMFGGIIMALREDVGLSWLVAVAVPLLGLCRRARHLAHGAVVRPHADLPRRGQPGHARADHRHPRRARLRPGGRTRRPASPRPTADLTNAGLQVGRLMALVFPIVMLIFNLSTVAVHVVRRLPRSRAGTCRSAQLTAFLSYLVQILMAVMMATFMATMIPRAAGLGRAASGGARHRVVGRRVGAARCRCRGAERGARVRRRRLPLPRGRGRRAPRRHVHGRARAARRRSSARPVPARRR